MLSVSPASPSQVEGANPGTGRLLDWTSLAPPSAGDAVQAPLELPPLQQDSDWTAVRSAVPPPRVAQRLLSVLNTCRSI